MPDDGQTLPRKSLFRRFFPTVSDIWNGRISLPKMFFFYFFAGSIVLALPINAAGALGYSISGFAGTIYALCLVSYFLLTCVGTWKSADHYKGPILIPIIIKFSILLIYIVLGISFLIALAPGPTPKL